MAKKEVGQIRLQNMTKRSLKEFNKTEAKGWVISIAIIIEDLIDDIILYYFNPENRGLFLSHVLNSTIMHYGGKLKLLNAIGIDIKTFSALQKIGSIRNAFAHTNITHQLSITNQPGKKGETSVSDIMTVMNGQGKIKRNNPYSFMVEFLELYKEVEPALKAKLKELEDKKK